MKETYFLWDVMVGEALARIKAENAAEAIHKAEMLLPGTAVIKAVVEYWSPGANTETIIKALENVTLKMKEVK